MTSNTQLHLEASELTAKPQMTGEQLQRVHDLGLSALALTDRDSRLIPIEEAKQILESVDLPQNIKMKGEEVLKGLLEETAGLCNLKELTFKHYLDQVSDYTNLPPREKIGQFHNDPQFNN